MRWVLQLGRAFNYDSTAVGISFDCTSTRYDYSITHFTTLGTKGLEYLFVGLPVSVFWLFHRGLIKKRVSVTASIIPAPVDFRWLLPCAKFAVWLIKVLT